MSLLSILNGPLSRNVQQKRIGSAAAAVSKVLIPSEATIEKLELLMHILTDLNSGGCKTRK